MQSTCAGCIHPASFVPNIGDMTDKSSCIPSTALASMYLVCAVLLQGRAKIRSSRRKAEVWGDRRRAVAYGASLVWGVHPRSPCSNESRERPVSLPWPALLLHLSPRLHSLPLLP